MTNTARSFSAATATVAPGLSLVEQEARALLVRLGRVKPFALQQTMVPAAALPPASLSAIDRYLIGGRRKVHRMVRKFIRWLQQSGRALGVTRSCAATLQHVAHAVQRYVSAARHICRGADAAQRAGDRNLAGGTGHRRRRCACRLPATTTSCQD